MNFLLGFIAVCILGVIVDAYQHRRRAKASDDPIGSIWYHIQQSKREDDEKRAKKKAAKKEIAQLKTKDFPPLPVQIPNSNYKQTGVSATSSQMSRRINARKLKEAKKKSKAADSILDEIQFTYPDRHSGAKITRRVSVRAVDKEYLEGHCHMRKGERTFLLHRIHGGVVSLDTGEIYKTSTWARAMRRLPNNGTIISGSSYRSAGNSSESRDWQTAAYFVGFRDAKRSELEAMADLAGWQVRTAFSSSLDVLVAGSLAGSAQMGKAESMGIDVISEDEFLQRL